MYEMKSFWSRFDFKAACLFTGYKNREKGLFDELDRVGIEGVNRLWQFPTPFDSIMRRFVRGKLGLKPGFFNGGMGHYRAIKTAYELGCSNSLIMEDDIRFLKDVDLIREIVEDLPEDYDIALLDTFKPQKMSYDEWRGNATNRRVSKHWCRFNNMRSFACYAMSRKGMERWIAQWEGAFRPCGFLKIADQYLKHECLGMDMNMYHAVRNVCIQAPVGGSACSGQDGCHVDKYREYGLNIDDYAIS